MYTELKDTMIKEIKEDMMTMTHQIENSNKEIESIKKNQMKLENQITEIKYLLDAICSRNCAP